ncbi:MAG: hypothetical protein ACRDZR_18080 [Acidimicrobiales bacterium]
MPHRAVPLVRQALVRATPRQRALVLVAMVAGGAVLVLLGHVAGAVLAAAGAVLLWRTASRRLHRRRETRGAGGRS